MHIPSLQQFVVMANIPSTNEVKSERSVAFLLPGGNDTPIDSNLCLNTCPPFLDLALHRKEN